MLNGVDERSAHVSMHNMKHTHIHIHTHATLSSACYTVYRVVMMMSLFCSSSVVERRGKRSRESVHSFWLTCGGLCACVCMCAHSPTYAHTHRTRIHAHLHITTHSFSPLHGLYAAILRMCVSSCTYKRARTMSVCGVEDCS